MSRSRGRMDTRTCETCSVTFQAYRSDPQRYCGKPCWAAATRAATPQEWFTCAECGERFSRQASQAKSQTRGAVKYCGKACLGAANGRRLAGPRTRVIRPCLVCGVQISVIPALANRKKYCSHKCRGLGVNENRNQNSRPRSSKIADEAIRAWADLHPAAPLWKAEHRVSRWTIDLAFPDLLLAVELDGVYWHSRPGMKEKDQIRDATLRGRGWTVRRIPIEQGATPDELAAAIAEVVGEHASRKAVA